MVQGEEGLVYMPMEADQPVEVILAPLPEDVARHVQAIEKVLLTTPFIGIALARELKSAGLEPLEVSISLQKRG